MSAKYVLCKCEEVKGVKRSIGEYGEAHLVPGTPHDGGEDCPGGVVPGESGLAHARTIVDHQSGNVLVAHVESSDVIPETNTISRYKRLGQAFEEEWIVLRVVVAHVAGESEGRGEG